MAIKFTSTDKAEHNAKILVFGRSGAGKTVLCSTAPKPLIISCESGLLSLKKYKIPVMEVSTLADLDEAYRQISTQPKFKKFQTICLDSISEMADTVLTDCKRRNKDKRAAFGEMNENMDRIIKAFRDLDNFNVYFSAREKKVIMEEDGESSIVHMADMPGAAIREKMPYLFDGVFYLDVVKGKGGVYKRILKTEADARFNGVKDRSGALDAKEAPNLTTIFNKIEGS